MTPAPSTPKKNGAIPLSSQNSSSTPPRRHEIGYPPTRYDAFFCQIGDTHQYDASSDSFLAEKADLERKISEHISSCLKGSSEMEQRLSRKYDSMIEKTLVSILMPCVGRWLTVSKDDLRHSRDALKDEMKTQHDDLLSSIKKQYSQLNDGEYFMPHNAP